MACAHVQTVSKNTTSGVTSLTTAAITTTSGNLIVAAYSTDENVTPFQATITDSKSNTYVDNHSFAHNGAGAFDIAVGIAYAKNITGGASHTFTVNNTGSQFVAIGASEFSGADTTAPADTAKPSTTGNSTACDPGAMAPGSTGDLYFTAGVHTGTSRTWTANTGAGFVKRTDITDAGSTQLPLCTTALDNGTGSLNGTITISGAAIQWAAAGATFIAAGGAAVFETLVGARFSLAGPRGLAG